MVILTNKKLIGVKDPYGIRPLVLGYLNGSHVLASETCALDMIGAKYIRDIENGEINILIGTHAIFEENVIFKNLGFAVIDEQHRFGVKQRAEIWKKNNPSPHILIMTATPIPRTLTMSIYGDLDGCYHSGTTNKRKRKDRATQPIWTREG